MTILSRNESWVWTVGFKEVAPNRNIGGGENGFSPINSKLSVIADLVFMFQRIG